MTQELELSGRLCAIAGMLARRQGMAAITNPLINSYKRLVPGTRRPTLSWSIPAGDPGGAGRQGKPLPAGCATRTLLQPLPGAGLRTPRGRGWTASQGLTPPAEIQENITASEPGRP